MIINFGTTYTESLQVMEEKITSCVIPNMILGESRVTLQTVKVMQGDITSLPKYGNSFGSLAM